ncbi:hypothetical protein [Thermoactinospora rubra]|uniref:hypothetical protein n=1 Tax=Thermoactinospora rubra TaxID=1088767 RepID=UPI000A10B198|nr:hypothetical protein [Thermoactinospora rubra]
MTIIAPNTTQTAQTFPRDLVSVAHLEARACIRCNTLFADDAVVDLAGTVTYEDTGPWRLWRCRVCPPIATVMAALAGYAAEYRLDSGGQHAVSQVKVAMLAAAYGVDPATAMDLVREECWDPDIRAVFAEADELIEQARRTAQAAEYGQAVTR